MTGLAKIIEQMRREPANIRFSALQKVCDHYFGEPRFKGSHRIYKMPWPDDPRVNIQNHRGKAKAYQVKQVLSALDKLGGEHGET